MGEGEGFGTYKEVSRRIRRKIRGRNKKTRRDGAKIEDEVELKGR